MGVAGTDNYNPLSIKEGDFTNTETVEVKDQAYNVEVKKSTPRDVLRCTRRCRPGVTPEALVSRALHPSDNINGDEVTREVKYPALCEPVRSVLTKRQGVAEDGRRAFLQLTTNLEKQGKDTDLSMDQLCEAVADGDEIIFTVYEMHNDGLDESDEMDDLYPNALAWLMHRMVHGEDIVQGTLGHLTEGVVENFKRSATDTTNYVMWKEVNVKALGQKIQIWRKPEADGLPASYRMEAVLEGSAEDFLALTEHMCVEGSIVKKELSPDTVLEEVLDDDDSVTLFRSVEKLGPWPMKKREYVGVSVTAWDEDSTMYIVQKSITDDSYPVGKNLIRATLHEEGYAVTPLLKNEIKVTQLLQVDLVGISDSLIGKEMVEEAKGYAKVQKLLKSIDSWYQED
eukprot:TRINITY_DN2025_c1_g3_i1.p1 TRINITY_DN2025_c1_g3~~TRINITY_DN2025_c1_g3_i1.p1  ORF type:complete len:398 (+),score=139.41 TRINITY_DN2025_c1_g3_i1:42-1235(+)